MMLKEKVQEWKDLRMVRKEPLAIARVKNQTTKICKAAIRWGREAVIPYIKDLTPELFEYGYVNYDFRFTTLPEQYKTLELCFWAVRKNSQFFSAYVPCNKWTPELCMEAVKNCGYAIENIPLNLITPKLCAEAVNNNACAIQSVPNPYITPELCRAAIERDASAIKHFPAEYQTEKLCLLALSENRRLGSPLAYPILLDAMRIQTPKICLMAVKQNGLSLKYVKEQTPEICLAAVKQNGCALKFVKDKTQEICFAAVRDTREALEYVEDPTIAMLVSAYVCASDYQRR